MPANVTTTTTTSADASAGGAAGDGDAGSDAPAVSTGVHFGDLVPGEVNIIKPGGSTVCSRGGEYSYVVIPGDRDKVVVEFEGGGACWDAKTCGFADAIFKDSIDTKAYTNPAKHGWHDKAHGDNPIVGWTHIYIPYCTGDLHWGDAVRTYSADGSAVTINHKGGVNAKAALDWMYAELTAPKKVLVTGCSAGGYGSIWWAPQVQKHYGGAKVYHFADSAAGVITSDFFATSFPAWNAGATFPSFLGDLSAASSLPALYGMVAAYYPNNIYSQYNTRYDENQTFYFSAMGGGDKEAWSAQMKANVAAASKSPNFRAFLPEGEQHCILPYDNFYSVEAGGKKLTEWISDMINDRPVATEACPGCAP